MVDFTEEFIREKARLAWNMHVDGLTDGSFQPQLAWFAENDALRITMFPNTNREGDARSRMAHAMSLISSATEDAERLLFVHDSYGVKPKHGMKASQDQTAEEAMDDLSEEWPGGSMEEEWVTNGPRKHMLTELFATSWTNREGWHAAAMMPYVRQDDGTLTLSDESDWLVLIEGEGGHTMGTFISMMGNAMTEPKLSEVMVQQFGPPSDEDEATMRRMRTICAAVKMVMKEHGFLIGIACHSDAEAEIVQASFGESGYGLDMHKMGGDDDGV